MQMQVTRFDSFEAAKYTAPAGPVNATLIPWGMMGALVRYPGCLYLGPDLFRPDIYLTLTD